MRILPASFAILGIACLAISGLFFFTPNFLLPQLSGPPVEILREKSGVYYDSSRGFYHEVRLRNRSDESQKVVVIIQTELDYAPRRSSPVLLSPHEETSLKIYTEVGRQSTSSSDLNAMDYALSNIRELRVEYAEENIPSGSYLAFFSHASLQILFFCLGGGFLAVAGYEFKKTKYSRRASSKRDLELLEKLLATYTAESKT